MIHLTTSLARVPAQALRQAEWMWRRSTAHLRVLPDYLIIGTQKGGTTSLHYYLTEHPRVRGGFRKKELHFFDRHYHRGVNWYRAHFGRRTESSKGMVTGESTPYYMFHPLAPQRIHGMLPNVKLIALLRNPIDRAISQYYHEVRRGWETLPIQEAFVRGEAERSREDSAIRLNASHPSLAHQHHSYIARGRYAEQLREWLRWFSRDQLLILYSEPFFADPAREMERVWRFLGCGDAKAARADRSPHNRHDRPEGDTLIRAWLCDEFAADVADLKKLLGEEPPWPELV